jgi:hypothetical protein
MMQGDIEKEIYKILNDVELNYQQKIEKIFTNKNVYDVYPFSFVNFVNQIRSSDSQSLKSYDEQILYFLENYLKINDNDRSELKKICDTNLIYYGTNVNTLFNNLNDLIYNAIRGFPISSSSYQPDNTFRPIDPQSLTTSVQTHKPFPIKVIGNTSDPLLQLDKNKSSAEGLLNTKINTRSAFNTYHAAVNFELTFPPPSKTEIWRDFDPDPDLKNSSHESSRSPSPPPPPPPRIFSPPPPPPRETSSDLKIPNGSQLPLPVQIDVDSNENIVSLSGINLTGSVLADEASSGGVFQASSKMIGNQQSQQGGSLPWPKRLSEDSVSEGLLPLTQQEGSVHQELLQLPKRLDSSVNNILSQQIIASSIAVRAQQDRVFKTDLAMQNNAVNLEQGAFVLPQRLEFQDSLDASLNITQGPAVVPMASDPSEPSRDGNQPPPNPGKPEKKPSGFGCISSRVIERTRRLYSKIPSCTSLKFPFASCLRSSRSRVEPVSK